MSEEEIIIHRIFDEYGKITGIAIDGAILAFLIKQHLNQNEDE